MDENLTCSALKTHYLMPEHSIMLCMLIIALWFCMHMASCSIIVSFNNSALYTNVYGSYMFFFSLC